MIGLNVPLPIAWKIKMELDIMKDFEIADVSYNFDKHGVGQLFLC